MLSLGFDPSFIDTIVTAKTEKGTLLDQLPPPGFHHRTNEISRIAGGNGVNVAYVLNKLGHSIELVVPTDEIFIQLLHQRGLYNIYSLDSKVNETVAIQWKSGEIQFNHSSATLGREQWTVDIHKKWVGSSIHIYLNWGLNPLSPEWIACQWLAACGWSWEEIISQDEIVIKAKAESGATTSCFIEPGSCIAHPRNQDLNGLLSAIAKNYMTIKDKFLFSCNEEEAPQFVEFKFPLSLVHSAELVSLTDQTRQIDYPVPNLRAPKVFVGAGDALLAGLIDSYIHKGVVDITDAIKIAQKYMMNKI